MFERYSERARRVLFFSRYEATQAGSASIEPEHVLLGVVREGKGDAARLLARAHVSLSDLRRAIEAHTARPAPRDSGGMTEEIPFAAATKRILTHAAAEADALSSSEIGPEHLLLGVLREEDGVAVAVLAEAGLTLVGARSHVRGLAQERSTGRDIATDAASGPALQVRIAPSTRPFERGTSSQRGLDRWTFEGFFLKPLLSQIFDIPEARMQIAPGVPVEERFDAAAALPYGPAVVQMQRLLQHALEAHFRVSIAIESRETDVYVLTAPKGFRAEGEPGGGGGALGAASFALEESDREALGKLMEPGQAPDQEVLRRIVEARMRRMVAGVPPSAPLSSISGSGSIWGLCQMLEAHLDRPLVDETGLDGNYRYTFKTEVKTIPEFLAALETELGLVATPAVREIRTLALR